jgi:hypothetical protein
MNFKTTIILLVLLAGAGIAVFYTSQSTPKEETAQTADSSKKLLNFNSSDVDKLIIEPADGKRIVLKQDGLQWQMLEPIVTPAETNTPGEILSDLTAMASTGHVSATGADAAATGLTPPQFKLEIVTKDGHSTKLDIGSRSGTGDQLYVHLDGNAQDDLVQADVYDLLDKPVSDFRRKKLLDVNTAQVQQVEVDRPEGKVALQKLGTNWFIKQPSIMPGDNSAISDLVMGLSSLQANDFVSDTDPNPRRYGLDDPAIVVSYSNAAPSTQPSTQPTADASQTVVKFGMLDVRKQYVYVSTSDSTAVARVPVSSMDAFKKTALDLRDKEVVNIDPTSVSGISIQTHLAATTRPTTRPASETLVTLGRRPLTTTAPATQPAVATTTPSPTTTPTTAPANLAETLPTVKHSVWQVTSTTQPVEAGDSKVDALLAALHPLKVTQYDASPTTAPSTADRYTITIQCPPPLISSYTIELTDPGDSHPLNGRYNDLAFEVDRSLLDKVKADFTHPDESPATPSAAPSASPSFSGAGPAVGPSGP